MFIHPNINPIALHMGPLKVRWYGLMYLLGFTMGWLLARKRSRAPHCIGWTKDALADLVLYVAFSLIIGGRLGYVIFYGLDFLRTDPWFPVKLWQGGMSFHGGLLGGAVGAWLFARRYHKRCFEVYDFVVPLAPLAFAAGRLGNFINGELWGRVTTMPWAMVFPAVDKLPRHPSQLYEALLEGGLLFIILWVYSNKPRPLMCTSGLFLFCYGVIRLFVECFRMPDVQIGYLAGGWLTMGQLLSLPMVVLGLVFFFRWSV